MDNISANTLVQAIEDALLRTQLKVSDGRGQCFDGATNMSGGRNGVATQISKMEKRAVFTHCYAHALNLAVGDSIKNLNVCCDAMDTAFEITKLITF